VNRLWKKTIAWALLALLLLGLGGCARGEAPAETAPVAAESPILSAAPAAPLTPAATAEPVPTAKIQVLMYHHVALDASAGMTVTPERLEEQLCALLEAGYETVTVQQLIDFVELGTPLPDKTLVLTFDDGYASNLEFAVPILEKLGAVATVFVIGVSVGKTTYKDTGLPMIPHFSYEDAAEAVEKGILSVQSHTYDMHQAEGYDDPAREGVLPLEGESDEDYAAALRADFQKSFEALERAYGAPAAALAYPLGKYTAESENVLTALGIPVSFRVWDGVTTLEQGKPETLRLINRYTVTQDMTGQALAALLEQDLAA